MHPTTFTRIMFTVIVAFGLIWTLCGGDILKAGAADSAAQASEGIAFEGAGWLYYLAPAEKQPRKLVKGCQPALSPDEKKIVYVPVQKDGSVGFGLMQLDMGAGQSKTLVAPAQARVGYPSWAPQGDKLAYVYDMKDILVINAAGSGRKKIFSAPGGSYGPPAWDSDGKTLMVNDLDSLFQIDLNGRVLAQTPLTVFTGKESAVSSTDRFVPNPRAPQLVAFTMAVEGTPQFTKIFNEPNTALFLYDTPTRQRLRLTPPDMLATSPCWSWNGDYIYFSGYREPNYRERQPFRLYRINKDGTGLIMLAMGENPSLAMGSIGQASQELTPPTGQAEPGTSAPKGTEELPLPPPPPLP